MLFYVIEVNVGWQDNCFSEAVSKLKDDAPFQEESSH